LAANRIQLDLKWYGKVVNKRMRKVVRRQVKLGADLVRDTMRRNLKGPRTGRTYPHPNGGTYTASAPTEYPAERTGALIKSIQSRTASTRTTIGGYVGTDLWYGLWLENFAKNKNARPWFGRTLLEERTLVARLQINMQTALVREFKKK
jgi:hypothetical protein